MVRGIYTGASSMAARVAEMNVVANNLANVNTVGYKRDQSLQKAFPEMLIRRVNDNGVHSFPLGSWDARPIVGRLGTGVEVNEVYTQRRQGSLLPTGNPFDLALEGDRGFFVILTDQGERYTRNGAFTINGDGILVTKDGFPVMGQKGILNLKHHNVLINKRGEIYVNHEFEEDEDRPVQLEENSFSQSVLRDTLRVVDFELPRYLKKEGNSFYKDTEESGEAFEMEENRSIVREGFLEASNVNVVREMVKMIEVQRAYEASQKTITAHDMALDKLINQMTRLV